MAISVIAAVGLAACDPGTFDIRVNVPPIQDNCPMVMFSSYAVITTPAGDAPTCVTAPCTTVGPNVHDCLEGGESSLIANDENVRIRLIMLGQGAPPAVLLCGESNMSVDISEGDVVNINLDCDSSCPMNNAGCDFAACRQQMVDHCQPPD